MKRNYTQDFIRALAIFLVVLLHVSAYFMGDNYKQLNAGFWVSTTFDAFARICVPLFVLSSGFFLIKEEGESVATFFKKRTQKLLIPLIFWSLVYSEYSYGWHATAGDIAGGFISGRPYYHFWFLFMLVGLYFAAPFVNALYRSYGFRKTNLLGFALLALGSITNLWDIYHVNSPFFLLWFIPYLGYFILGHTLPKMEYKIPAWASLLTYVAAAIALVAAAYLALITLNNSEYAFDYLSPLVIVASLSSYMFLVNMTLEESWITKIAQYSLGIYLIHVMFMEEFFQLTNKTIFGNAAADILSLVLGIFIASWASIYLISKIPLLKRTI